MAEFNSYHAQAGGSNRLARTANLTIPAGTSSASAVLWVYHETGYTTDADQIQIQTSPDGTTWTNRGTAINRYDGSTGWKQHTVDLAALIGAGNFRIGYLGVSAYGNDTYMDDVSVSTMTGATCTTGVSGPPGVPNGISGTAMKGSKTVADGSSITVTWDKGCTGSQYEIVYGRNGLLPTSYSGTYGLTGVVCPIGTTGTYSWAAPAVPSGSSFIWWLVVATDGATTEGSWGKNTSQERTGPGSGGSSQGVTGACATTKSIANSCGQ
jgi:hypothetical protein